MPSMRTLPSLAILLAIAACQPESADGGREPAGSAVATAPTLTPASSGSREAQATQADAEAARAAIEQVRRAWVEAAERDDASAIAALYAEDGVVIDPLEYAPVEGREAIQKVLATELPTVGGLELRSQDFHASGDLAYDYGEFSERIGPPGAEAITIKGHYLLILRRQEDGAWKLVKKIAIMSPRQLAPSATE